MFIEFTVLNVKLLILLIFPIFDEIEDYTLKEYIVDDNQLFKAFRYFLSYIIAGIFLIIYKIRNRKLNIKDEKEKQIYDDNKSDKGVIEDIAKKKERKRRLINIIFIIALSGIGLFCQLYRNYLKNQNIRKEDKAFQYFLIY